jgi:signal transduction histidine kinase
MFEPFRTASAYGTGLGLAIVYNIVREHRGDISLSSEPGRGTELSVRLPAAGAESNAVGQEGQEAP